MFSRFWIGERSQMVWCIVRRSLRSKSGSLGFSILRA